MLSPLQFVTTGPNRDYLQRTTQGGLHRRHTRERVDGLQQALAAGAEQDQACEAIRDLIDKVVLTPVDGVLLSTCTERWRRTFSSLRPGRKGASIWGRMASNARPET